MKEFDHLTNEDRLEMNLAGLVPADTLIKGGQRVGSCPFCGGYELVFIGPPAHSRCAMTCMTCFAIGPQADDPAIAIDKWNHNPTRQVYIEQQ